jgi:hypothetical protein
MATTALDARTRHAASQVLYQIFPDRFAIGAGKPSIEKLKDPAYAIPRAVPHDWDDPEPQIRHHRFLPHRPDVWR